MNFINTVHLKNVGMQMGKDVHVLQIINGQAA
jgi:hypothetical protein